MKKIAALLAAFVLATSALVTSEPLPVSASCSQASVTLWSDHGYNGPGLVFCYDVGAVSNLANYGFNNRASSVRFSEGTVNTTVCLYSEPGYVVQVWRGTASGDSAQWVFWPNDVVSSLRFGC